MISERYELAMTRIGEITEELKVMQEYEAYFNEVVGFIKKVDGILTAMKDPHRYTTRTLTELQEENRSLYLMHTKENYENSYLNPVVADTLPDKKLGSLLCFLYTELQSMIAFAYEDNAVECVIRLELFLEVYSEFAYSFFEEHSAPKTDNIRDILYWFVSDYADVEFERKVREQLDSSLTFARNIIQNSDLQDLRYLYRYGECVTENELETAKYLNSLPQDTIVRMADTFTEGFKRGFELAGKDLSKKNTVSIRYRLGFERVIRQAIINFEIYGLSPVFYRARSTVFDRRGYARIGYYGAVCNPQFDFDHKEDEALILDGHIVTRKTECLREAYKEFEKFAASFAGPACMEVFGEVPFAPVAKKEVPTYTQDQQQMVLHYTSESAAITNEFIKREERSFTIIAFPVFSIGSQFREIFDEVIKLNTLDYRLYTRIQQSIIDVLNTAQSVRIKGYHGNKTDLKIMLCKLDDPSKQTIFENCVADVNIPVGEVFTSPILTGTNGILHVSRVFLHELEYRDLELTIENGYVTDYSCANFTSQEENKKYIKDNLLYHYNTLPIGEFAIGTNTVAYAMAKKFAIESILPILIAEKMGPHFALGDTCYSQEEDIKVYNPDGKEIVAKENERSALRKTKPEEAYFHCHTDITIPYDELQQVVACTEQGEEYPIIENSRFVLCECAILNESLDAMGGM